MKAMSKVLVLATITLMSASAFAADGAVGEKKDPKDCVQGSNLVQKAQDSKAPAASDDASKDSKAKKAD